MASLRQNVFFLLQLSLLLCTSITVPAEVHVNPPVHVPVNPHVNHPINPPFDHPINPPFDHPINPPFHHPDPPFDHPINPPFHRPINPPFHHPDPQNKLVAVQGRVFCKSCTHRGFRTNETPLFGALVKLECHNTLYPWTQLAKTDRNGFFYFPPQRKLTAFGSHTCKVSLVSSPKPNCAIPTNLNGGATGTLLTATSGHINPKVQLFTVGPFAFKNPHCYYIH